MKTNGKMLNILILIVYGLYILFGVIRQYVLPAFSDKEHIFSTLYILLGTVLITSWLFYKYGFKKGKNSIEQRKPKTLKVTKVMESTIGKFKNPSN